MGCGCDVDVSASSGVRAVLHRPIRLGAEPYAQRVLAALDPRHVVGSQLQHLVDVAEQVAERLLGSEVAAAQVVG